MNPERYDAFKLGYVSELVKLGNLVPITTIPITPDLLISPFRAGMQMARAGASAVGSGAAYVNSPTEQDTDIAKLDNEAKALNEQAKRLQAQRRQRIVAALLAKRQKA